MWGLGICQFVQTARRLPVFHQCEPLYIASWMDWTHGEKSRPGMCHLWGAHGFCHNCSKRSMGLVCVAKNYDANHFRLLPRAMRLLNWSYLAQITSPRSPHIHVQSFITVSLLMVIIFFRCLIWHMFNADVGLKASSTKCEASLA